MCTTLREAALSAVMCFLLVFNLRYTEAYGKGQLVQHRLLIEVPKDNQCSWDEKAGECSSTNKVDLAAAAKPTDIHWQFWMMAMDRMVSVCTPIKDAAACRKKTQSHRCRWLVDKEDPTNTGCSSIDFLDAWYFIERWYYPETYLDIPFGMACPGSMMHDFLKCTTIPGGAECTSTPGCTLLGEPGKTSCWPATFAKKTDAQVEEIIDNINSLSPAYAGSCASACWLRQARACHETRTKGLCEAQPYCVFNDGGCYPVINGGAQYDKQTEQLRDQCAAIRSKEACNKKLVAMPQAGKWRDWVTPTAKTTCALGAPEEIKAEAGAKP